MSRIIPHFETLPSRITLSVFGGNLLMSVCIAFVLGFSVYRDLCHQAEVNTLKQLENRSRLVDTFLQEMLRAAGEYRTIENSFKMKTELGRWWETLPVPPATDAVPEIARVDLSLVKGMVRYTIENQSPRLPAGVPGPLPLPCGALPVLHTLFNADGALNLSIVFPVDKDSRGQEGIDVVFCNASELERMLQPTGGIPAGAHLCVASQDDVGTHFLTSPGSNFTENSQQIMLLRQAIKACTASVSTSWAFIDLPDGRLGVAPAPLMSAPWELVVAIPADILYGGALKKSILLGCAAVALALFLSSFTLVVVRPFMTFFKRVDHLLERERANRHRDSRKLQHYQWLLRKKDDFTDLCCSLVDYSAREFADPAGVEQKIIPAIARYFTADMVFVFAMRPSATSHFYAGKKREVSELNTLKEQLTAAFSSHHNLFIPELSRKQAVSPLEETLQSLGSAAVAGVRVDGGACPLGFLLSSSQPGILSDKDILKQLRILGTLIAEKCSP